MAESRGVRGNAVLTGFKLHRPAAEPLARRQILRSFGQDWHGAGIQACCVTHGCLCHRLGSHVQWARSVRGMDRSPTALAYQLPRVASSTPGPVPPQRAPMRKGRSGPYGQHGDLCDPGVFNQVANASSTSREVETPSPGSPADWSRFGVAQVDLFASPETTQWQEFFLIEATLVTDALAHSWPQGLRKYAFPQWAY